MLFNSPKDLINKVANIIKEGNEKYSKEQAKMNKLVAEKMLSPKQKKIAALAGDQNKIDAADFAALRAGKQVEEDSETAGKPFKYNKKTGTFHEAESLPVTITPGSTDPGGPLSTPRKNAYQKALATLAASKKAPKLSTDMANRRPAKEETDTPGNGRAHQCAVHVKHKTMGEGKTLTTQHALPDETGAISWYDVMFAEGIVRVATNELEVLVSEEHTHNKKSMKKESSLDEGRGRPRMNPDDPKWKKMEAKPNKNDDEEEKRHEGPARPGSPHLTTEPDKHISVQLKVAHDMKDEKGGSDVKFANGKTHFVRHDVAGKVLHALDKLKPADRAEVHDHIAQSHHNLMAVHKVL
jgi:hypothetical protein